MSVPSSFRTALSGQNFQGMVAIRSLDVPAIEGFGMSVMEKLSASLEVFQPMPSHDQTFAHVVFAEAQQLTFDGEGRVLLPQHFREHAKIDESIIFVGRGLSFQLWNPDLFYAHQEEQRQAVMHQRHMAKATPLPLHQVVS